jgi:hypothetical protein
MISADWSKRVGESKVTLGGENGRHQCGRNEMLISSVVDGVVEVVFSRRRCTLRKLPLGDGMVSIKRGLHEAELDSEMLHEVRAKAGRE